MASKKRAVDVAAEKANPYVQRVLEDDDLRANITAAFEAARDAYERLSDGKAPHKALVKDKKLQKDLKAAAVSLREAGTKLAKPEKKRKRRRGRKTVLLVVVGGGLALVLSEGLRNKVLDTLFGKEEEFEYSSTTSPSTPAQPVSAG
jgi:ferric-dicitrate binding protein FerR (iron transport regulator)